MNPVYNGPGSNPRVNNLVEDLTEGLTDGVTFELMRQALDLRCGHSYNESTIVGLSRVSLNTYVLNAGLPSKNIKLILRLDDLPEGLL